MAKNTKTEETQAPAVAEQAKKGDTTKIYKFKSANKFLTCVQLGVQFINGEATTSKLEVAKALAKIDGVELVED